MRLPEYLKRPIIDTDKTRVVRRVFRENRLNTVCENARCPNKGECYAKNTATFLIMGNVCTRNCLYCNISCAKPASLDANEPKNIAKAVKALGLKYAVLTSVTRDDLPDGGAAHFKQCVDEIRALTPDVKVEILTPDFKGGKAALDVIIAAQPDVFNHNIEAVRELFASVRPQADYERSLEVLRYIKAPLVKGGRTASRWGDLTTKSGLMVGLGETFGQIEATLRDLHAAGVDIVTIGQYIQPSKSHLAVAKYYAPEEYADLRVLADKIGFRHHQIGPLVRSSYRAAELI
ncbi:MAG: lipoyl synthase [Heliobacteriaceae bacterium]|jgi:lipoic acid synthetase|nr:lipoyl synthase [Heliobacteriaceae bacterium]